MTIVSLLCIVVLARAAAPPKPIEQMSFGELLNEGKEAINNITLLANMAHHPQVVRMQNVLNAFSKTLPLVSYDQSISPLEKGADGLIHSVFHPIDTAGTNIAGLAWDVKHITQAHSAFIILRGLIIFFCIYIIIGAIIMAKYYNADGIDRIPHLGFWMAYPGLVVDGIAYVSDRMGCEVEPSTYQRLSVAVGSKQVGSRDTFSQFEPI